MLMYPLQFLAYKYSKNSWTHELELTTAQEDIRVDDIWIFIM